MPATTMERASFSRMDGDAAVVMGGRDLHVPLPWRQNVKTMWMTTKVSCHVALILCQSKLMRHRYLSHSDEMKTVNITLPGRVVEMRHYQTVIFKMIKP